MTYLVDANVLSEPTRTHPNLRVVKWLNSHRQNLVIDPIILGELYAGVQALPAGRKRTNLEDWFEALTATIECVPWDRVVGLSWARLIADMRKKGTSMPILDSMIAATA